jgi:hypothetical protein
MSVPDTVRLGSHGDDVAALQQFLARHFSGTMTIPPDVTGSFDEATENAVRALQSGYGIDVDGVVGPDTWTVIAEVDPRNWEEGSDNNPMQMEAMVFGPTDAPEEPTPSASDEALAAQLRARTDPQLAVLVAVVDVRLSGEPLSPDILDATAPSTSSERWLQELETVEAEVRHDFEVIAGAIETSVENLRTNWQSYQDELRGVVGRIAEGIAGTNALNDTLTAGDFDYPLSLVKGARASLDEGWFAEAARSLEEATESLESSDARYHQLIEDTRSAASFAVKALELTKDASFLIVTTIAAGQIMAAYQITGLLGKAAVSGAVALAGNATETIATKAGHVLAGTSDEFDLTEELAKDIKDSIASFAGGAVGGQFMASFGDKFTDKVASKLGGYLGDHAKAWVDVALKELLSESASSLTESVMVNSVDGLVGQKFDSTGDFVTATVEDWMDRLGGAKADLVADAYRLAADPYYEDGEQPPVKELLARALRDALLASE